MQGIPTVGAIAAAMLVHPITSGSVHTIAQHDRWRTSFESSSASVSSNGRYVAFASYARLDLRDRDDQLDVYVLDRRDGSVSLESAGHDGDREHVDHRHPRLTADGHMVVYERAFPTRSEIVLRDRVRGASTTIPEPRVSATPNDYSRDPAISRDGRLVVFSSTATHLVPGDANGRAEDVYAYDRASGTFERISVGVHGIPLTSGSSIGPSVSANARFVVFSSTSDLTESLGNAASTRIAPMAVYVFDRRLKMTRLVSRTPSGDRPNAPSWAAALSGDGRYVVFTSDATNLVADDRNQSSDVFVAELGTGRIDLVSRTPSGSSANGRSAVPAISDDGQVIAFQSEASDMLCRRRCVPSGDDINLLWDVFVLHRPSGTMRRVSRDTERDWMEPSVGPALDGSGSVVTFSSRHPIDGADVENDFDLFVWAARP